MSFDNWNLEKCKQWLDIAGWTYPEEIDVKKWRKEVEMVFEDHEEFYRILALSEHLGVEPESIHDLGYNFFEVNPHTVYDGTSPEKAHQLVNLLREALTKMVKYYKSQTSVRFFAGTPLREISDDPSNWTSENFRIAPHLLPEGDIPITYENLTTLMRACPETAEMLKVGIHDVVNTLYFLSPQTDDYDHAKDHRDTLREVFDGKPVQDRRKPRKTNYGEYLVVTDEEADRLWDGELESYLDDPGIVPGSDSPYFDRERWKRDARMDGRAHAISRYDGREDEQNGFYIYRQN